MQNKIILTSRPRKLRQRTLFIFLGTLLVVTFGACSQEKKPEPDRDLPEITQHTESAESKWSEILLRPTDSTRVSWLTEKENWPEGMVIQFDSTGHARISDLNLATVFWTFKNLDYVADSLMSGLRFSLTVAASHVPNHLLMSDFIPDSALFFRPGEATPVARRLAFLSRRTFLEGVWQVEIIHEGLATGDVDLSEGTRVKPKVFVSWSGKSIVFDLPVTVYEYVRTPQPLSAGGK